MDKLARNGLTNSLHRLLRNNTKNVLVASLSKKFCYFRDKIDHSGGYMGALNARVGPTWNNFHDLLPVFSEHCISFERSGCMYNYCVCNVILYAKETWPLTTVLAKLNRNDNVMLYWIKSKRLFDRLPIKTVYQRKHVLSYTWTCLKMSFDGIVSDDMVIWWK